MNATSPTAVSALSPLPEDDQDAIEDISCIKSNSNRAGPSFYLTSDNDSQGDMKDIEIEETKPVEDNRNEIENENSSDTHVPERGLSGLSHDISTRSISEFSFSHASSADDSFLNNPYELHKEIIRLKLEVANLQSSLDTHQSLTLSISEERYKLKRELLDMTTSRDDYNGKYDDLLVESKKLSDKEKILKQDLDETKLERDELKRYNDIMVGKAADLEISNKEKENIISDLMRNIEASKRENEESIRKYKKAEEDKENLKQMLVESNLKMKEIKTKNEELEAEREKLTVECRDLASHRFQVEETMKEVTKERNKLKEDCGRLSYENDRLNCELDAFSKDNDDSRENGKQSGPLRRKRQGFMGFISMCSSAPTVPKDL